MMTTRTPALSVTTGWCPDSRPSQATPVSERRVAASRAAQPMCEDLVCIGIQGLGRIVVSWRGCRAGERDAAPRRSVAWAAKSRTSAKIDALATCRFIRARENVLFLGLPGLGKSHLVGSLEPGKDGDLMIYDGDPSEYVSRV